ncbi:MAG: hypothetical protein SF052_16180 [Bacteroidia bacterium]|nr:hypothetical protein [Bacteroidia bacterium]
MATNIRLLRSPDLAEKVPRTLSMQGFADRQDPPQWPFGSERSNVCSLDGYPLWLAHGFAP